MKIGSMRIGVVTMPKPLASGPSTVERIGHMAREVERLGFAGLWTTDAIGRGWPTADPLIWLASAIPHTKSIEIGTCVLQVPIRHPVELAHRVQTLNMLSNGRLRLGVGTGSTKADFDVVQADYEARFKTLPASLEIMQRVFAGKPVHGPIVSVWPSTQDGPPMLIGAWRSPRWIDLAATKLQGWISSGIHTKHEDLEIGLKMFREARGKRAVVANIFTDFRAKPDLTPMIEHARISLICTPEEARKRLRRLADMGVDDALLVCPFDTPEQLETMRGLA
jgi:alkanesulfonate monooxygenase SsuD/methylene tetrahydromethanopterin reductase-like flavin-dependent oxidoreductase (luciferase family)